MGLRRPWICWEGKFPCLWVLGNNLVPPNLNTQFKLPEEMSLPNTQQIALRKVTQDARCLCMKMRQSVFSILPFPAFFEHRSLFTRLFYIWAVRDWRYFFSVCFSNSLQFNKSNTNSGIISLMDGALNSIPILIEILHWNAEEPQTKTFQMPEAVSFQLGWKFPLITSSWSFNIVLAYQFLARIF